MKKLLIGSIAFLLLYLLCAFIAYLLQTEFILCTVFLILDILFGAFFVVSTGMLLCKIIERKK